MPTSGLPAELEQFIHAKIDSVEQMEVLLHLEKNSSRDLTADALAAALYSNADAISMRLRKLESAGLVSVAGNDEPMYRFRSDDPSSGVMVSKLARYYQERPVAVITAILSRKASNVQAFSDAFIFGKRKDL